MKHGLLFLAAGIFAPWLAHAAPVPDATHAFGLNGSYSDELGGSPLVPSGGRLGSSRYHFSFGQGLTLTGAVPADTYSIEMQIKPTETLGYQRLIDFKQLGWDGGLYLFNGALEFYPYLPTQPVLLTPGKQTDITITRDGASSTMNLYVDGQWQISFNDFGGGVFTLDGQGQTVANFFLDDNGECMEGSLNHLRVFDRVLSAADVQKLAKGKRPGNVTGD